MIAAYDRFFYQTTMLERHWHAKTLTWNYPETQVGECETCSIVHRSLAFLLLDKTSNLILRSSHVDLRLDHDILLKVSFTRTPDTPRPLQNTQPAMSTAHAISRHFHSTESDTFLFLKNL